MLSQIKAEIRDVQLDWTDQFIEDLFPNNEAEVALALKRAQLELPPPLDHPLTFNMALDLSGATRKMKAYMFPMAKNLATGRHRDARDAGFDAIRKLKPYGDKLAPAVDFLDRYWDTCPEKLTLDMIGIDCVDPSKARIKIYAHLSTRNSWDLVRHISTFGGQATDFDRLKGLEILHSLWNIMRNEQGNHDDAYDKPLRHPTSFLGSIMFSFEILPGRYIPDVKIYIPMWQYAPSDGHIANNLMSAFRQLGWNDVAENYLFNLRRTFPGADLDSPLSVLHSNLSYSYSPATGAYMSVYYAISGKATIRTDKEKH
ncbi:aromatic prenyltransferase [Colletotrichum incanum]|nr:aromatic prenyltransferase [Colletotrichum incanum]